MQKETGGCSLYEKKKNTINEDEGHPDRPRGENINNPYINGRRKMQPQPCQACQRLSGLVWSTRDRRRGLLRRRFVDFPLYLAGDREEQRAERRGALILSSCADVGRVLTPHIDR